MSLPEYLLDLPAEEAARLIALALLDRTAEAARRLLDPTDPTALHDFRVATRRLRSCLQAYRPEIDGSVSRRLRRRLARLARDTTRSRDAEVHLAWERDQAPALSERQRAGLRWHLERLEARRRRADRRLARHAARKFAGLEAGFRRRLERYRLRIERDPARRRHEAAAVLGSRIRKFAGDLECRLGAVRTMIDEAPAHRARIAAKRLRYLLEPIRSEVDGVEPLIGKLRELQDALGELHDSRTHRAALLRDLARAGREHERRLDASVRAGVAHAPALDDADDPRPGLLALAERLEEREAEAFARLRADWLAGAADGFFEAVTRVGKRIANRPACVAEIERRFLLRRVPATALAFARQEIEQGWLPGLRLVERITSLGPVPTPATLRTSRPATGAGTSEPDGDVDAELFQAMWPLTAGRRIRKRRHVVSDYGLEWEIDQYLDRDLVLLEVTPGADAQMPLPDWLEPYVVREVTGESDFTARALAH
ncbi:MAG TPA: CHAD domain-containing protein [Gemmatimonadales bacterium]|nr:CHAD domain-containing protein [Gemmatimonadales bacterium]